jgi:hypothetical protein
MAKKDKVKKDKKRKPRRERKSKLPSSVEALLGYLGKTETTIASQSDPKPRERAGVDAYDTLHQIIKSQQMQSANYMANLERMAFRTEFQSQISEQLKRQGEESSKAISEASGKLKAEVAETVEKVARTYTKQSTEDKLKGVMGQMKFAMRTPEDTRDESWKGRYAALEQKARKYQGDLEIERSFFQNPPAMASLPSATSVSTARMSRSASVPRGGGFFVNQGSSIAPPESVSTSQLPSQDPLQNLAAIAGGGGGAPKTTLTPSQEVQAGKALMQSNIDVVSTSGTPASSTRRGKRK